MKKILLVGDLVGYGKIALSSIIPILSEMGMEVSNLPTALVSNTFDYKISSMLDTTTYMNETIEVWRKLNLQFDIILTGFLSNIKQVSLIENIISFQKEKPLIITDPILGDDGVLYHGLKKDVIDTMKKMIYLSDIILPNVTESQILANAKIKKDLREEDVNEYIELISKEYNCSVVVTSSEIDSGNYIFSYDNKIGHISKIKYEKIPYKFAGTGDLFAGLFTGLLSKSFDLHKACERSSEIITTILKLEYLEKSSGVRDVKIEKYLEFFRKIWGPDWIKNPIESLIVF